MRKSKYTEEQIIGFLRQVEAGMAVKELGHRVPRRRYRLLHDARHRDYRFAYFDSPIRREDLKPGALLRLD